MLKEVSEKEYGVVVTLATLDSGVSVAVADRSATTAGDPDGSSAAGASLSLADGCGCADRVTVGATVAAGHLLDVLVEAEGTAVGADAGRVAVESVICSTVVYPASGEALPVRKRTRAVPTASTAASTAKDRTSPCWCPLTCWSPTSAPLLAERPVEGHIGTPLTYLRER
jgi:hypothetical protein